MEPRLDLSLGTDNIDFENIEISYLPMKPLFLKKEQLYIAGFKLETNYYDKSTEVPRENKIAVLKSNLAITGFFGIDEKDRLDIAAEQNLVKISAPAILFPYVRATMTLMFANSGFPGVIFPLLNINHLAEKFASNLEVEEILD
ncbi:protein-export chaperone SecB [Leptospira levettii]|uniref:protein-export chaperone SecB n=1 Tax=Leptospira levettii TaxID=2023178 RepID=UPI0013FD7A19|nr:protein-export chaperone SecB [Leptospira levettii]